MARKERASDELYRASRTARDRSTLGETPSHRGSGSARAATFEAVASGNPTRIARFVSRLASRPLAVIERTCVARHDWLHGLAPCPTCGLPLDPDRDPNEERDGGLSVTHLRCGARFVLELEP